MNRKYILYGAVGRRAIVAIRAEKVISDNKDEILCYVDRNYEKKDGSQYPGTLGSGKIYNPEIIKDHPDATVVVLASDVKGILNYIRNDLKANNEVLAFPAFKYGFPCSDDKTISTAAKWIEENQERLRGIYDLNDLDTSVIIERIISQRKMDRLDFVPADEMIGFLRVPYFIDEITRPDGKVTVVDGGAYIGDTVEELMVVFGDRLSLVYAFEPDEMNYEELKRNTKDLPFEVHTVNAGLGDTKGEELLRPGEMSSLVISEYEEGCIRINIDTIDLTVNDVVGTLLIKMDIEGSELAAIKGAKETIRKYHPYMSICVYHKMEDILTIPEEIISIRSDYRFLLRAGTHTELYAIPR